MTRRELEMVKDLSECVKLDIWPRISRFFLQQALSVRFFLSPMRYPDQIFPESGIKISAVVRPRGMNSRVFGHEYIPCETVTHI